MASLTGAGIASYCSCADGNTSSTTAWAAISSLGYNDDTTTATRAGQASTTNYQNSGSFVAGSGVSIDGIALQIYGRLTTGTFSVALDAAGVDVSGTVVTCNVTDMPLKGWVLFKFGSPVSLTNGTTYSVKFKTSTGATVTLCGTATGASGISRFLRTPTTGTAPQAASSQNDNLYAMGEITGAGSVTSRAITWDITGNSWAYNSLFIGYKCTVTVENNASTNYYIYLKNTCRIFDQGVLNIGTSTTAIQSTSTCTFFFLNASNVQNGCVVHNGGTLNMYGGSKTPWTTLTANLAASGTSITVAAASGWLVGDTLCFPSTTATYNQDETKAISSVSGTTIGIAAATNAHSGTSPYIGEVGNLTRNVVFRGTSSSLQAYLWLGEGSTTNANYAEFTWLGSSNTTGLSGINVQSIDSLNTAVGFNFTGCSIHDCSNSATGFYFQPIATTGTPTLSANVFYNIAGAHINLIGSSVAYTLLIDGNLLVKNTDFFSKLAALSLTRDPNLTFTNNNLASSSTSGIGLTGTNITNINVTISGNTAHSNVQAGVDIGFTTTNNTVTSNIGTIKTWRNAESGIRTSTTMNGLIFDINNWTSYANTNQEMNFAFSLTGIFTITNALWFNGSTPSTPYGVSFTATNPSAILNLYINNSDLGSTGAHSGGDFNTQSYTYSIILCQNCLFSTTPITTTMQANFINYGRVSSTRHNQVNSDYKNWGPTGTLSRDTSIYSTSSPSVRATPINTTNKLVMGYFEVMVPNAATPTVSIKVRKSNTSAGDSATYNGNSPRFMLQAQPAAGVNAHTVLATATSSANGAWQTLTATLPAPTGDTIYVMFVDCDGSAGWINVDDFQTSQTGGDDSGMAFNSGGYPTTRLGSGGGVIPSIQYIPLAHKKVI